MTICAQQLQVAGVGFPIFETPGLRAPCLEPQFCRRVDVVNVEGAEVVEAASAARRAKLLNQSDLLRPPFGLLVQACAVLVAERLLAFQRAIAHFARFSTLLAAATAGPAMGKVARLATVLSGTVAQSVGVNLGWLIAACANDRGGCGSHACMITKYCDFYKPRYFDIACRRIEEAYRQPRLFAEPRPQVVQEAMF